MTHHNPESVIDDLRSWQLSEGAQIIPEASFSKGDGLALHSEHEGLNPTAICRRIPTEPGTSYRLTYRVRGDQDWVSKRNFQWFRVSVSWEELVENGKGHGRVTQEEGMVWQDTLQAWQLKTLRFKTPEKPTAGMSIRCELKGPGSIHLDDFKLEITHETEDPLLQAFRQTHLARIPVLPEPREREKFFPIGLWYSTHLDADLNEFAGNGINTLIVTNPPSELLDRIYRANLRAIISLPESVPFQLSEEDLTRWVEERKKNIAIWRNHPATLAYLISDEPLWRGVSLDGLKASYELHRRLDPAHPIWINEAPRNTVADLARYAEACDITGVDIYPIPANGTTHSELPEKGLFCVGQYAEKMKAVVGGKKPVWMTLQAFAWKQLFDPAAPGIYPSQEELRFMAYDSILHGALGLMFYGTPFVTDETFWDALFATTSEISAIANGLVSETSRDLRTEDSLRILSASGDKAHIVIAGNYRDENWEQEIDVPAGGGSFKKLVAKFNALEVRVFSDPEMPHRSPTRWRDSSPLFQELTKLRAQGPRYQGRAFWIWYPERHTVAGHRCWFTREFQLAAPVIQAELIITAVNNYQLEINGRLVGRDQDASMESWIWAERYDIADFLKDGENVIRIHAQSGIMPPSGLLVDCSITLASQETLNIVSDQSWQTSEEDEKIPAGVICKFGEGNWANHIYVRNCEPITL